MVVYSKLIPVSDVIKSAVDYKSVAIVGCAACANYSIAYEKDLPIMSITKDETTGQVRLLPYALMQHANQIQKLLEEKGVNVVTEVINAMCFVTDDSELSSRIGNPSWADQGVKDRCSNAEAFIGLGCSGALFGLRQRLGKDIKIIPGMRQAGTGQYFVKLDEEKKFIVLDKDRTVILRS
jgi:hypothetical protein